VTYMESWSLSLDLQILLQTIIVILEEKRCLLGKYSPEEMQLIYLKHSPGSQCP